MDENLLLNCLKNEENILIYINSEEELNDFKKDIYKYCNKYKLKYSTRNYTALHYHRNDNPTIFYTYIPYKAATNIRLLNAFTDKRIDRILLISQNNKLLHLI